jgi:hypothetical protein
VKHSIILEYTKVIVKVEFYVYVTDFFSKRRKIYSFSRKNVVYIVKIWVTIS